MVQQRHVGGNSLYFLCFLYLIVFAAPVGTMLNNPSVYRPVTNCVIKLITDSFIKETKGLTGSYLLALGSGSEYKTNGATMWNVSETGTGSRRRENPKDAAKLQELKLETLCHCVATSAYKQGAAQHFREECHSMRLLYGSCHVNSYTPCVRLPSSKETYVCLIQIAGKRMSA
jgi:hypothetical protein